MPKRTQSRRRNPLPPALRERAKLMVKAARESRIQRARALIAEVNDRKAEIAGAFWDIGRDLIAVRELDAHGDPGHGNFHALCLAEMGTACAKSPNSSRIWRFDGREASHSLSVCPSTSSMVRNTRPPSTPIWYTVTTFGWLSLAIDRASRKMRLLRASATDHSLEAPAHVALALSWSMCRKRIFISRIEVQRALDFGKLRRALADVSQGPAVVCVPREDFDEALVL